METEIFPMQTMPVPEEIVARAAAILRQGGLLGLPTETVYGLGADGLNPQAIARIFLVKGRPQDNPLILHIPQAEWLSRYCQDIPDAAFILAQRFWPGPLTLVLKRKDIVPDAVTCGLPTVGIRCPRHDAALAVIRAADTPVAAPSGNLSGRPSPTCLAHMLEDMDGRIDGIVDGGPCAVGVESTIVDMTVSPPCLLRPGGLPVEALRDVLGGLSIDPAVSGVINGNAAPKAPGMKYRHYAPQAPVTVVTGDAAVAAAYIRTRLAPHTGVLCFDEYQDWFPGAAVETVGREGDEAAQARCIFQALRAFDGTDTTHIYAQCPREGGLGLAVANRLKKAAGFQIVSVGEGVP